MSFLEDKENQYIEDVILEIGLVRAPDSNGERSLLSCLHTSELLSSTADELSDKYGLTQAQFNALMVIYDYKEKNLHLRQIELANRLLVKASSVNEMLKKLIDLELVSVKSDKTDGRANLVKIESRGENIIKRAREEYFRIAREKAFSNFTPGEQALFTELQLKFRENLRKIRETLREEKRKAALMKKISPDNCGKI